MKKLFGIGGFFPLILFSLHTLAISSENYRIWRNHVAMSVDLIEKVDKLEKDQMLSYDSLVKLYDFSKMNRQDGGCYEKEPNNYLCICHGSNGLVIGINNYKGFIVEVDVTSSQNNIMKCL